MGDEIVSDIVAENQSFDYSIFQAVGFSQNVSEFG